MGHRAEKQMYGSMKRFLVARKEDGAQKPHWKEPKRKTWKRRHLGRSA